MSGIDTVMAYCGWHVAPSLTETVEVEGMGSRVLLLPSLHVTDVTAVRDEDGTAVTDWKARKNGVVRGWWSCEELYELDIVHGYPAMPEEVQEVIDDLDSRPAGSAYVQVGQVRVATDSDGAPLGAALTAAQRSVLDRYKLPSSP